LVIKNILRWLVIGSLRRLPLKSGVTAIAYHRFILWLIADLPDTAMTTLRDGTPIATSPHDHDGSILYLFGTNDPKVTLTIEALLDPGDVFLDIGANHATIGFAAARVVGDQGTVHVFEPQRKLGDRIVDATKAGHFRNITLHRMGLLDVDGSFELRSPRGHSGSASFAMSDDDSRFNASETCNVRAIAPYVGPLVAGRPFAAKIDVEGAEPKILPWLVAQPNLRFLIFEASNNEHQLYDNIRAAELLLYGLVRHPLFMQYRRIDSLADISAFHDVIAINAIGLGPARTDRRGLAALLGVRTCEPSATQTNRSRVAR
jgi:FkbM family methyltransferase